MAVSLSPDELVFFAPFVASIRRCETSTAIDQDEIRDDLFQAATEEAFGLCGLAFAGPDNGGGARLVITEESCLTLKNVHEGQDLRATVQLTACEPSTLQFVLALRDARSGEIVALSSRSAAYRCPITHGPEAFPEMARAALAQMLAAHAPLPIPDTAPGHLN